MARRRLHARMARTLPDERGRARACRSRMGGSRNRRPARAPCSNERHPRRLGRRAGARGCARAAREGTRVTRAPDLIADLRARRGEEAAHADAARGMFERIAPTYDVVNRVMSAGFDQRWRARAIAQVQTAPAGPVLDLCAGTLDLAGRLARLRADDRVVAVDFSAAMLEEGRRKAPTVDVVVADAAALPFEDGSFAAVICGFGMRNLAEP